jgi:hypothetical protein
MTTSTTRSASRIIREKCLGSLQLYAVLLVVVVLYNLQYTIRYTQQICAASNGYDDDLDKLPLISGVSSVNFRDYTWWKTPSSLHDIDDPKALLEFKHSTNTAIATKLSERVGMPFSDMHWSRQNDDDNTPAISCGQHKCFVPSRTNQSMGYLIGRGEHSYREMRKGCELEARMARKYGITQLTIHSPMTFWNLTDDFPYMADLLRDYGPPKKSKSIFVTAVLKVPTPHLLVKLHGNGPVQTKLKIPEFARRLRSENRWNGQSLQTFRRTFHTEVERLLRIVRDPNHLNLMLDFQFLLDTSGRIFYIDFERASVQKHPPVSAFQERYANLEASLQRLSFWLTENEDESFAELEEDVFCIECDEDEDDDAT